MAKSKQPVPVSDDEVCALLEEHANQAVFLQPLIRPPSCQLFESRAHRITAWPS